MLIHRHIPNLYKETFVKPLLIIYDLIMFLAFAWFPVAVLMTTTADFSKHPLTMFLAEGYACVALFVLCAVLMRWWYKAPARATWFTLAVGVSSLAPLYTLGYKWVTSESLLAPEHIYSICLIFGISFLLFIKGLRELRRKPPPPRS